MKCLCNESKPARTFLFVCGKGFGNFERFINLFTQNNGFQSFIVFILLNENMKNFSFRIKFWGILQMICSCITIKFWLLVFIYTSTCIKYEPLHRYCNTKCLHLGWELTYFFITGQRYLKKLTCQNSCFDRFCFLNWHLYNFFFPVKTTSTFKRELMFFVNVLRLLPFKICRLKICQHSIN